MTKVSKKVYYVLSGLFWAIRQFGAPNPFEILAPGITVKLNGASIFLTPDVLNWIAGCILPTITFGVVGLYYVSGSFPELGSFLYMFFFVIHSSILSLMASVYPNYWLLALIAVVYIGIHIGIIKLQNHLAW